ncbi:MAG: TolC family protein, partial [Myxococcota bacterium]
IARLGLLLDGAESYWKWVAAGQAYKVALSLVRLAEARDQQLAEKVRQGAVAEIERAENLRAVLDRRQDLVVAQRALEQAAIKLSLFIRDNSGEPVVPGSERLPELPLPAPPNPDELDAGQAEAMAVRPEIEFYRAEVSRAQVLLRLAENQVAPELDLSASLAKDLGSNKDPDKVESLDPTEFKVGLTLKLPFLLRKARGKRDKAEAKLDEVRQKARFQRDKLITQVLNLWSALNAQAQQSKLADETYRVAEAVAAAERRRFDLGVTTLFIVNLREQKAAEAARKRVKARADFAFTRSAWSLATRTRL